ncbi:FGFR1 oncogene partner isoform X2 [Astyanax mexicanus]|uniref:FGFR1 oncogene partner isoform X2 n=1 Tax=Astyanax mexicanus TaxID=7994 RepID=UPI000BBD58EB|nr:FGFR1 oncogene partner isoform X2 [Astyanax mexicanus]
MTGGRLCGVVTHTTGRFTSAVMKTVRRQRAPRGHMTVGLKMSATEEDTELRDLLIQNLENNGVLNKIKAELRAAVFLALEEQDKVENKTPLVNENLKKCLNTKDGRLVASLITDFLQVFNLDFTLAVFQPEINTLNGLDGRESLFRELGLSESEGNKSTPLLLEVIKRGRHKDRASIFSEGDRVMHIPKELSPRQIAEARKKYDSRDKDRSGGISKEEVIGVFSDLFPTFSRGMLERYVTDELEAKDKDRNSSIDFQDFLGMYKRLFIQCRSVVVSDGSDTVPSLGKIIDDRISSSPTSKIPRYKGFIKPIAEQEQPPGSQAGELSLNHSEPLGSQKSRAFVQQVPSITSEVLAASRKDPTAMRRPLDLGLEDDDEEGDSFFDDPLPKPQKTYGCLPSTRDKPYSGLYSDLSQKSSSQKESQHLQREESLAGPSFSQIRRGTSLNDLSAIGSDTEGDGDDVFSGHENKRSPDSEPRRADSTKVAGKTPSSLSDIPLLKSGGGSLSAENSQRDPVSSKSGTSYSKEKGLQDFKEKTASPLPDEDLDYDDDFNSHRSDNSKSEVSIGEEIEEVSIEGPDFSDKLDEITQDLSLSQLSQGAADYMEDVA